MAGPNVFGSATTQPALFVTVPTAEWNKLTKADRIALVDTVEGMVQDCRREPERFLEMSPEAPFYPTARERVSRMCSGCWMLATGPSVARDEDPYDKIVVVGDSYWGHGGVKASVFRGK